MNGETLTRAIALSHEATRADLLALPENVTGEIIDGQLYVSPRPFGRHSIITTGVASALFDPFHKSRGGPGGWWILSEPGVQLPGAPEIAPDVAGWRRENLADASGLLTVVPDWVCEVLSTSTRRYDLHVKRPYYARVGVSHIWMIDPDAQALTASRNVDGQWLEIGVWAGDERMRAAPFDAIEIELSALWQWTTPH